MIDDIKHMPNQKWHRYISFLKSTVRVIGYVLLPYNMWLAAAVLLFSETLGFIEELV